MPRGLGARARLRDDFTPKQHTVWHHHASRCGFCRCHPVPVFSTVDRRLMMKTWQIPAATDLRFGFEITMYVAAR